MDDNPVAPSGDARQVPFLLAGDYQNVVGVLRLKPGFEPTEDMTLAMSFTISDATGPRLHDVHVVLVAVTPT